MAAKGSADQPRSNEAAFTPSPREGVKDTIDSVVVAFILAFVFRAFLVEAFVIPTGSMAPTLYGKHGTITCEDCGWEFAYALADQSDPRISRQTRPLVRHDTPAICPNCNHENRNLRITDLGGPGGSAEPGDRILVLKWPFDIAGRLLGPRRWDVTVFKDPSKEGPHLARTAAAARRDGTQNYIKRLLGLPDEVLEIIDGDVYTVPVSELSEETLATCEALRHIKYLQHRDDDPSTPTRWQIGDAQKGARPMRAELDQKLRICRKPPLAQESLWTVVYDHDYPPQQLDAGQPFWTAQGKHQACWDTSGRRIRGHCLGQDGGCVQFSGKGGRPFNTDFCAYNINHLGSPASNPVADLRLQVVLAPHRGSGPVRLGLSKYAQTFWAEIRMDGTVALYRTKGPQPDEHAEPLCLNRLVPFRPDRLVEVSFQNVDYRVSLDIDGREVLATNDQQYAPDLRMLRSLAARRGGQGPYAEPRIAATDLDFELWHVVLSRDVYYSSLGNESSVPGRARTGWGTTNNPIWLREGEYFMLGDNSAASKDSRLWEIPGDHLASRGEAYQLGTVPRDQLIGRAFFVYWPAGHRSDVLPFLRNVGLIPNFGRMRWIR